jgi:hypothetical protein
MPPVIDDHADLILWILRYEQPTAVLSTITTNKHLDTDATVTLLPDHRSQDREIFMSEPSLRPQLK